MSDLDKNEGNEEIEQQLILAAQANREGKIKGTIVIAYLANRELSVQIAGDFETYTNTLGLLEAAKDLIKIHKQQSQQQQTQQKKPLNWGPGGNA